VSERYIDCPPSFNSSTQQSLREGRPRSGPHMILWRGKGETLAGGFRKAESSGRASVQMRYPRLFAALVMLNQEVFVRDETA